jgi:nitrate/nitrite transport system substrate-binding protein
MGNDNTSNKAEKLGQQSNVVVDPARRDFF